MSTEQIVRSPLTS